MKIRVFIKMKLLLSDFSVHDSLFRRKIWFHDNWILRQFVLTTVWLHDKLQTFIFFFLMTSCRWHSSFSRRTNSSMIFVELSTSGSSTAWFGLMSKMTTFSISFAGAWYSFCSKFGQIIWFCKAGPTERFESFRKNSAVSRTFLSRGFCSKIRSFSIGQPRNPLAGFELVTWLWNPVCLKKVS